MLGHVRINAQRPPGFEHIFIIAYYQGSIKKINP
jgi:hypothetical protein